MNMPDPFAICLGVLPIAIYLLLFGVIRIAGRSLVISGGSEVALIGLAITGFVAIGPAQLFFPQAAGMVFGWKVWLMLAAFYLLCVVLASLSTRPRLSIIGRTSEEAFPAIVRAAQTLDPMTEIDERKMQVFLPQKNVRLRLDSISGIDHVSLLAFEHRIPFGFWQSLSSALKRELRGTKPTTGGRGIGMLASSAGLVAWAIYQIVPATERLAEGFRQWLLHQ